MARTVIVVGAAIAATVPLLFSSIYLYRLHDRISSQTTRSKGRFTSSSPSSIAPKSLPAHVASDPDSWIIHYERVVSRNNPVTSLSQPLGQASNQEPSALLRLYSQSIHCAFSRTPQAFMLASFIKDPDAKRTFNPEYINTLEFQPGQRVNGAYTVVYIGEGSIGGSERVELALDAPNGYKGPTPQGRILTEILPVDGGSSGEQVVFVNETWMWRKPNEPKTLLEGGFGAWLHALASGWLIIQGLKTVRKTS